MFFALSKTIAVASNMRASKLQNLHYAKMKVFERQHFQNFDQPASADAAALQYDRIYSCFYDRNM